MVSKTSSCLLMALAVLCVSSAVSARELLDVSDEDHGYCYVCSQANHQASRCSGWEPTRPTDNDMWCSGAAKACIELGLGCIVALKAILSINALVCAKVLILIKANLAVFLNICAVLGVDILAQCCRAYPFLLAHLIAVLDVNLCANLFLKICVNLGLVGVRLIVGVWDSDHGLCDPIKVTAILTACRNLGSTGAMFVGELLQTCKASYSNYWGILEPVCGPLLVVYANVLGIVKLNLGIFG